MEEECNIREKYYVCIKKLLLSFFSVIILLSTSSIVFADGHGKCKPSKWGADDEIGAANYVSEKRTKLAAELVKQGKSHPLGIAISSKTPAFPPRTLSLTVFAPNQSAGANLKGALGISYDIC